MTIAAQDTIPPEIAEAIALYRAGQPGQSGECLRRFLLAHPGNIPALLWLARVSADDDEAAAAALLALKLDPENEVARRAVAQRGRRDRLAVAEPTPPREAPAVVTLSRYLEREERRRRGIAVLSLGPVTILFVLALLASVLSIVAVDSYDLQVAWWIVYIPIGVMVALWIVVAVITQGIDTADNFRTGRRTEEDTVDALRAVLDGRWTLVKNFQFPNQRWGDVDLVLVGPGGVWALEVKGYSGLVRNVGDRWWRRVGQRWYKLESHPGKQARRNAARLKAYLKEGGAEVEFVEAAVIWASREANISVIKPATPVWTIPQVTERAQALRSRRPLTAEQAAQIVRILSNATPAQ